VLAHVTALVEKSLLTAEPQGETTRYGMLETIRQYAREQLAAAGRSTPPGTGTSPGRPACTRRPRQA